MGYRALTVTGGGVWIVLQVGAETQVMQLDPSNLAVEAERFLPGTDTSSPLLPVLTATVGGPLWVADGDYLWSLNPSTGMVVTEYDARTGQELVRSYQPDAVAGGTVAATNGEAYGCPTARTWPPPPWSCPAGI